jgi:hypothetical protein
MKKVLEISNWIILSDGPTHAEATYRDKRVKAHIVSKSNDSRVDCVLFLESLIRGAFGSLK